ncbi:MAG: hypothetical protein V7642_1970 [Burkholderiales bacterium]
MSPLVAGDHRDCISGIEPEGFKTGDQGIARQPLSRHVIGGTLHKLPDLEIERVQPCIAADRACIAVRDVSGQGQQPELLLHVDVDALAGRLTVGIEV